jgi:hypothetical protein
MANETVVIPRSYLRLFLIILIVQTVLLIGIGALTLWINFKINWFQRDSPDPMFDLILPLISKVH